ncbi:MAG: hypothetical protein ACLR2E_03195 [Lachnospiraceae bacterium]
MSVGWACGGLKCDGGAAPRRFSGSIPHPVDALFETVSGFTTTGSSILFRCGRLCRNVCLFGAELHSLGRRNGRAGLYAPTILPMSGGYHMNLMRGG